VGVGLLLSLFSCSYLCQVFYATDSCAHVNQITVCSTIDLRHAADGSWREDRWGMSNTLGPIAFSGLRVSEENDSGTLGLCLVLDFRMLAAQHALKLLQSA
jgi:hypothetical protein